MTKRASQGIAECEHALALDRNLAQAHSFIGRGKIFVRRAEETEAHVGEALRLSPRDTFARGVAKLHVGSWEQGAAWLRRAIEANRNFPPAHVWLAAARLAATLAVDSMGYSPLMGGGMGVREHCEALDVPDTLALGCLPKTHR